MMFREISEPVDQKRIDEYLSPKKIRRFISRTQKRIEAALDQLEIEEADRILSSEIIG
jgi:hypothetical protein